MRGACAEAVCHQLLLQSDYLVVCDAVVCTFTAIDTRIQDKSSNFVLVHFLSTMNNTSYEGTLPNRQDG